MNAQAAARAAKAGVWSIEPTEAEMKVREVSAAAKQASEMRSHDTIHSMLLLHVVLMCSAEKARVFSFRREKA